LLGEILNKISNHISIALNDDNISAEEFSFVLSEVNTSLETFQETKEKLHENVEPFLQRMRQALKQRQNTSG